MNSPRKYIDLEGFEVRGLEAGSGDVAVLSGENNGDWLPVQVPGGVHDALIAAGRIQHPFYGANEIDSRWVADKEWWYRLRFAGPQVGASQVRLVFEGLDTVADVWLNEELLGHHENMFRPAEFDITERIKATNVLLVRFTPPLLDREIPDETRATVMKTIRAFATPPGGETPPEIENLTVEILEETGQGSILGSIPRSTSLRKSPFSFGWDFGPRIPNIGLWRPVRLSIEPGPRIEGHHFVVDKLWSRHERALVSVAVEASSVAPLTARVTLASPSGAIFNERFELIDGSGSGQISVPRPEIWWTHDLGGQPLYTLTIELLEGSSVVDELSEQVGIRTVSVDQSDDHTEGGKLFQFRLNGVPVFARGANWVPPSMFVGSIEAETYRDRVGLARQANFTMLRVWGGGIYEHEAFYQECDKLGIMVWQDFMFACLDYPSERVELQREVALEAEYQVKRLRNHPSLALWAGNNEIQSLHSHAWGNVDPGNWGWDFFHRILPDAVSDYDGVTPYWPSSPWGEGGIEDISGSSSGDKHSWEVWHGIDSKGRMPEPGQFPSVGDGRHYRRYAEDKGKFVSEFGIHSSPELATLQRWIAEPDLTLHSPVFDGHNKDSSPRKGDDLLAVTTGLPRTIEEYVLFTQSVQAEGMLLGIEHYRRRQPHTSGALIWQFNDVWPGFSWSLVDYDGVPKAAYFAASRAFSAIAASFLDREDGGLELWLVNNSPSAADTDIEVELANFSGSDSKKVVVGAHTEPGESKVVWEAENVSRGADRFAWASAKDSIFPAARKHFAEIGQLELGESELTVEVLPEALRIRSTGYSYMVRIEQPSPGIHLSDNCFDLPDGREQIIAVRGIDPSALAVASFTPRGPSRS
jgi:beta-mannosidase